MLCNGTIAHNPRCRRLRRIDEADISTPVAVDQRAANCLEKAVRSLTAMWRSRGKEEGHTLFACGICKTLKVIHRMQAVNREARSMNRQSVSNREELLSVTTKDR
ncbi:hypothetical protein TNCV_3243271 [Trichonephila clavipes]|nr:hypothetical protein TNCV_3243271 [Trichonephila clavipes]